MARRKGRGKIPIKSQGKTTVRHMPAVPNAPRMSAR